MKLGYSREQVEEIARETAEGLLDALEGARRVEGFVDAYAAAENRRGLKSSPLRYRELQTTISREALLAMVAHMEGELPRRLGGGRRGVLRGTAAEAVETFREAFFAHLAAVLRLGPGDVEEFRRDLGFYAQLNPRAGRGVGSRRAGETAAGPFVDRCALLLDSSLLDKARKAASKFQAELEQAAEEVLAKVFRKKRKV